MPKGEMINLFLFWEECLYLCVSVCVSVFHSLSLSLILDASSWVSESFPVAESPQLQKEGNRKEAKKKKISSKSKRSGKIGQVND